MKMTFTPAGTPVIPESRVSWKLGFIIYAVGNSHGKKSSLARLHLLHTVLLKYDFFDFNIQSIESLQFAPWVFDPAVNTAINVGIKENLLCYSKDRITLMDPLGMDFFQRICTQHVFLACEEILKNASKKINETFAQEILKRWAQ